MQSPTPPTLSDLFALLDAWRHLPSYRLEPRADPFFALFLPGVLADHLGVQLHPIVVPEFPLRKGTLWGENIDGPNASTKVDYLAFDHNRQRGFLIELKTDALSRNQKQDAYLQRALQLTLSALIDGVLYSSRATSSHLVPKYFHLLQRLAELGFVELPRALLQNPYPPTGRERGKLLREVRNSIVGSGPVLEIVYIQPKSVDSQSNIISFEQYAAHVENQGDIGRIFAAHLRRWIIPAGSVSPWSANRGAKTFGEAG